MVSDADRFWIGGEFAGRPRPIMSLLTCSTSFADHGPYAIVRVPHNPTSSPESQISRIERLGRGAARSARTIAMLPALPLALSSAALYGSGRLLPGTLAFCGTAPSRCAASETHSSF